MQIGRDRRRRGHGVRQPEMERELRRFGERPAKDQQQRRQVIGRGLDRLLRLQDLADIVAAGDIAEDQHPRDHRKATHAGDGQRHARALPALGQVLPVTDQQEGRQRGQLPEDQQQQDVIRQHDADHRALKQHQIGVELPDRVFLGQIVTRIEDDQQPDPEDQDPEQKAQPVDSKAGIQPDLRQPGDIGGDDTAGHHGRDMQAKADQCQRGRGGAGGCRDIAPRADQQSRQKGAQKGQHCDQGWRHLSSSLSFSFFVRERGGSVKQAPAGKRGTKGLFPDVRVSC